MRKQSITGTLRKLGLHVCHRAVVRREWRRAGNKMDFRHPRDINEKIQWLLCSPVSRGWDRYADKLAVRDYVAACGLEDLLVPLLGVWDSAEAIDFAALPRRAMLKCNHDSGSSFAVDKEAAGFDEAAVRAFFARKLRRKFGYVNGEMYYNRIRPRVLAEPFLEPDPGRDSIPDFKVWCFDGKPYMVWACINRKKDSVEVCSYSPDWTKVPDADRPTPHYRAAGDIPRPQHLERMLAAAATLSRGFPVVRVDFYEAGGKLYFSEMTFAPYGGRIDFHTPEYLRVLGDQCRLPL